MVERHAPKVSAVIPCFNVEYCPEEGVSPVLSRSLVSYELVAFDGGSTDATLRVLEKMPGTRDVYKLIIQASVGVFSACNVGLAIA